MQLQPRTTGHGLVENSIAAAAEPGLNTSLSMKTGLLAQITLTAYLLALCERAPLAVNKRRGNNWYIEVNDRATLLAVGVGNVQLIPEKS